MRLAKLDILLSFALTLAGVMLPLSATAQIDTAAFYSDKVDSLSATVFTGTRRSNYISRLKEIRTEVISTAGLQKMACCNLAESFENSASVTVGYSDAVTGARQIQLLGLSGVYTQMLDENRPVMRGLSAPFGLSYVPGPWLESIQIAKGSTSVINGVESITGQINLEHKKPTDEKPLFLNLSVMNDTKVDFNAISSLQVSPTLYTAIFGHVSGNFKTQDMNMDTFMDDPKMLQFNVSNRWFYYTPELQVRWGVRAIRDTRKGGQQDFDYETIDVPWQTKIINQSIDAYVKVGKPLREDQSSSIAFIADYCYQDLDSWFEHSTYFGDQHSAFLNLLYRNQINEMHDFTVGLRGSYDFIKEDLDRHMRSGGWQKANHTWRLASASAYGEYTFHTRDDIFSAIVGVSADAYRKDGIKVSPRVTLKFMPSPDIVFRANAGRGLRYSFPLVDNIGVFSTGRLISGANSLHVLEDAWTMGGNATFYMPFGVNPENTYISFDYFRTDFKQQMIVDKEQSYDYIEFYTSDGHKSFTDNYQVDFNVEPFDRFTVSLTGRYTNAKITLAHQGLVEKPLTSRFKGVLNLQYRTNLNRWIFDFTASVNGSSRVYNYMEGLKDKDGNLLYKNGRTPTYPLLYAQITRRLKGFDIYVGGENLTGFRQKQVIISSPSFSNFDASSVWGPIMGARFNLGVRFTIWK